MLIDDYSLKKHCLTNNKIYVTYAHAYLNLNNHLQGEC